MRDGAKWRAIRKLSYSAMAWKLPTFGTFSTPFVNTSHRILEMSKTNAKKIDVGNRQLDGSYERSFHLCNFALDYNHPSIIHLHSSNGQAQG